MELDPATAAAEDCPQFKRPRFPARRETASVFRPGGGGGGGGGASGSAVRNPPGRYESESSMASAPTRRGVQRRSGFYHAELLRGAVLTNIALQQEEGTAAATADVTTTLADTTVADVSPDSTLSRSERRRKFEPAAGRKADVDDDDDDDDDDEDTLSDNLPSDDDDDEEEEEEDISDSDEEDDGAGTNLRLPRKRSEATCPSDDSDA